MRREAAIAVGSREFKGTLVVTAFDPSTYAIKGMIVPHEIESNWIQMTGDHIGNGFGNVAGPKVGSADALDGDQFNVEYDNGDPNTPIATHRIFSDSDVPPTVQAGEMMRRHQLGQQLFFNAAGDAILSRDDGSMMKLKANGDAVVMAKSQGGMLYHGGDPGDGGTFDFVKTVSGVATNVKARIG